MKDDGLAVTPILVEDLNAVLCRDRAHVLLLLFLCRCGCRKRGLRECFPLLQRRALPQRGQSHAAAMPSAPVRTVRRDSGFFATPSKSVISGRTSRISAP